MSSALGSDGSDITSDSYDDFYDDADDIWYEMNDVYDNTDHTALLFAGVIFVVIFMIVFVIIMTVTILWMHLFLIHWKWDVNVSI